MIVRNRRGNRQARMRARLAVASAVLAGGAAIGVVAVAASSHPAPSAAQSAGYTLNFGHEISEGTALSTALSDWTTSPQKSLSTLAEMAPLKNFATARHGKTVFAAQRGVVVLATKHWLLVKSANGSLHLWLVNGATRVKDVAGSVAGMTAMTGSKSAATAATTVAQQTNTPMTTTKQLTFAATDHVKRGDLIFIAGIEKHGQPWAQLVLFAPPAKTTARPTATPAARPTATPSASATVSGTHF
ncbi:MAG: hypothetical protein JWM19_7142 [Actinomycetia bacterium]|nr:hypothetical protein [Actinomycetes bacterium]